jgi:hypothetical protein
MPDLAAAEAFIWTNARLLDRHRFAHRGTGRRKNICCNVSSPWKMLPSLKPRTRSMSTGVITWR